MAKVSDPEDREIVTARTIEAPVTFSERGRATEVVMRAVFPTEERRDEVVERYGALEGAKQTLERLAAHIASIGGKAR